MTGHPERIAAAAERAAGLMGLDLDQWVSAMLDPAAVPEHQRARSAALSAAAEVAESDGNPGTASRLRTMAAAEHDQQAFFSEILGRSYTPAVWGYHGATHVTRIRKAMDIALAREAPECADVIAALVFDRTLDRNRSEFVAHERDPKNRRRFGHSDDPVADFAAEVSAIAAAVSDPPADAGGRHMLKMRIFTALSFRAGAVEEALDAKARLRALEAEADRL